MKKILELLVKISYYRNAGIGSIGGKLKDSPILYKFSLIKNAFSLNKRKASFILFLCLSVLLIVMNIGLYFYYSYKMLNDSIEDGQAALINVENDSVIVGNIIQDQLAKEEQKKLYEEAQNKHIEENKGEDPAELAQYVAPELSDEDANKSKVVIIVKDLGLSKSMTLNALDIDTNFTLGFSPYAQDVSDWIEQATTKGFEVTLNLPMQPADYPVNDPGPYAMLHNLSNGENLSRLDWILSRSNKTIGLYTADNETFTNSRASVSPILENLKKHNQILIFGNQTNEQTIKNLSESYGMYYANSKLQIDTVLDAQKIKNNLLKLEGEAMSNGYAIGYINPYPLSLSVAKQWLSEIDNSKLILVPVSKIFKFEQVSQESIVEYEKEKLLKGVKEVSDKQDGKAPAEHAEPAKPSASEEH